MHTSSQAHLRGMTNSECQQWTIKMQHYLTYGTGLRTGQGITNKKYITHLALPTRSTGLACRVSYVRSRPDSRLTHAIETHAWHLYSRWRASLQKPGFAIHVFAWTRNDQRWRRSIRLSRRLCHRVLAGCGHRRKASL